MITVKPSQNAPNILTFDGEVLEEFYGRDSQRVHITHITGIQLNTDNKGNHELIIKTVVGKMGNGPYLTYVRYGHIMGS